MKQFYYRSPFNDENQPYRAQYVVNWGQIHILGNSGHDTFIREINGKVCMFKVWSNISPKQYKYLHITYTIYNIQCNIQYKSYM